MFKCKNARRTGGRDNRSVGKSRRCASAACTTDSATRNDGAVYPPRSQPVTELPRSQPRVRQCRHGCPHVRVWRKRAVVAVEMPSGGVHQWRMLHLGGLVYVLLSNGLPGLLHVIRNRSPAGRRLGFSDHLSGYCHRAAIHAKVGNRLHPDLRVGRCVDYPYRCNLVFHE
jgi:hypothetical protein